MDHRTSDLQRRLNNVTSYGTIAEVDHATGRVRVDIAGRLTGWLPAPGSIGQNFRAWTPVRVGTQVLVAAPSGDPANGVISQILYSQGLPPPGDTGDVDLVLWNDGARVHYDSAAQAMLVAVPAGGTITTRVGAASIETSNEAITLKVGGTSIVLSAAGIFLAGPTIGMTAGDGAGAATLAGNFAMHGQLAVTGDVSASGSIMDTGGNSNHHSH